MKNNQYNNEKLKADLFNERKQKNTSAFFKAINRVNTRDNPLLNSVKMLSSQDSTSIVKQIRQCEL